MKRHIQNVMMTIAATAIAAGSAAAQATTIQLPDPQVLRQAQEATAAAVQTLNSPEVQRALNSAEVAKALALTEARVAVAADVARVAVAADAARFALTDVAARVELAADAARFGGEWAQSERRDAAQRAADDAMREKERAQREREREGSYYEQGQNALDSGRWERAVSSFDRVIELKGTRADAALYWKAYAQNKQGLRPEALATLGALAKEHPKSRYLNDARALEVEVKQNAGQGVDPGSQSDEELKLLALSSLQNSEDAIPVLQKVLQGTGSPKLKQRALFVLGQSSSPKAREVLVNIAKGGSNPDLQMKAVQYLGIHGGPENRAALADIYAASSDVDLKGRILRAFAVAGDKQRVLAAAQSEPNGDLRAAAVQQLGVMNAGEELWALYQKESTVEVKKQIIRAMAVSGNVTRMTDIAKSDTTPELRLSAVRSLGVMGSRRTGDTLVEIYNAEKDADVRKAVINALFVSNNAEAIVALARKEQDPVLKREMVAKLSHMRSKVATDFLLEILNK